MFDSNLALFMQYVLYSSVFDMQHLFQYDSLTESKQQVVDRLETVRLFSFLQILTAIFGAFAHGGNDVRYISSLFII